MLGETRTPDLFLFLTWQNDTSGTVGTGQNNAICLDQSFNIAEARTDDSYSGSVILLADLFNYQ